MFRFSLFFFVLFSISSSALSTNLPSLVDGSWLVKQVNNEKIKLLDIQTKEAFQRYHIAKSVNAPFDSWRTDGLAVPPKSLPEVEKLELKLRTLGLNNDDKIIIIATGASVGDLSAAARVYWTLKLLGHEEVAILNGGLVDYVNNAGGSYASGSVNPAPVSNYKIAVNLSILATAPQVLNSTQQRLDARSRAEYVGLYKGGDDERAGTLENAKNLSFDWLSQQDRAKLRSNDEIKSLFELADINTSVGSVHFCHTGNRASLTWFADYALLGNKDAKLYDGSMIEWAKQVTLPIDKKLKI